jgi:uncharacterized protein (DUF2062 family)
VVFKRRDPRPWWRMAKEFLWPRGGWGRAFHYIKHRLRRLPDSPHKISRGIMVGVFTTFTPFYGIHFVIAAILARAVHGNILAALLATFFGNPLTYVPIGAVALKTGHFLLGTKLNREVDESLLRKFGGAGQDLMYNLWYMFSDRPTNWSHLGRFWDEVFFPYMIGGIVPGVIAGVVAYYISLPLIAAYQKRRMGTIKKKLEDLRRKAAAARSDQAR